MNYLKIGNLKVSPAVLLISLVFLGVIFFKASQNSVEFVEVKVAQPKVSKSNLDYIDTTGMKFTISETGYWEIDGVETDFYVCDYLATEEVKYLFAENVEVKNDSIFCNKFFTGLTLNR